MGCCELRGCGWRETPVKGPQEDKKLRERRRGREDERDTGHQMPARVLAKEDFEGGSLCIEGTYTPSRLHPGSETSGKSKMSLPHFICQCFCTAVGC